MKLIITALSAANLLNMIFLDKHSAAAHLRAANLWKGDI